MDKTAALIRRASDVRRRIFASLPWDVRFAEVWKSIASDAGTFAAWGRAVGKYLLDAGVTEMPPPGPGWDAHPGDMRRLPSGYLAHEMAAVYKKLFSEPLVRKDPSIASEAVDSFLEKLHTGRVKILPVPLEKALKFVLGGCFFAVKDIKRVRVREMAHEESTGRENEEGEAVEIDIADPNSIKQFQHLQGKPLFNEWLAYLGRHTHPDVPLYMNLRMEGYTNEEIVGCPLKGINETMLPHYKAEGHPIKSDPTFWGDKILKDLVRPATEAFLESKGLDKDNPVLTLNPDL
jgi:hypothetical protein